MSCSADEWLPDILIPLAFDRASQTKVTESLAKEANDYQVERDDSRLSFACL